MAKAVLVPPISCANASQIGNQNRVAPLNRLLRVHDRTAECIAKFLFPNAVQLQTNRIESTSPCASRPIRRRGRGEGEGVVALDKKSIKPFRYSR